MCRELTYLCCRNHSCGLNWYFLRDLAFAFAEPEPVPAATRLQTAWFVLEQVPVHLRLRDVTVLQSVEIQIRAVAVLAGRSLVWFGESNGPLVFHTRITRNRVSMTFG